MTFLYKSWRTSLDLSHLDCTNQYIQAALPLTGINTIHCQLWQKRMHFAFSKKTTMIIWQWQYQDVWLVFLVLWSASSPWRWSSARSNSRQWIWHNRIDCVAGTVGWECWQKISILSQLFKIPYFKTVSKLIFAIMTMIYHSMIKNMTIDKENDDCEQKSPQVMIKSKSHLSTKSWFKHNTG